MASFDTIPGSRSIRLASMRLSPTSMDVWIATELAQLLGRYPLFDLCVQSAIRHNVLGGLWFGLLLFAFTLEAVRGGDQRIRRRIMTILVGSVVTILCTFLAASILSWPPPNRYPALAGMYPAYLDRNPAANCFPSQSTALYASVAAGVYSLKKVAGSLLWIAVALGVALPRMYVGGHYFSDAVAGLLVGGVGYVSARYLVEPRLLTYTGPLFGNRSWRQILGEVVIFVWILQVTIEFRDVEWVVRSLRYVLGTGFGLRF